MEAGSVANSNDIFCELSYIEVGLEKNRFCEGIYLIGILGIDVFFIDMFLKG